MFATSYINHLHRTLNSHKEKEMLRDIITGKEVHIPKGKELSDHMKRSLHETKEVLDHKGDKFFRLEERAHIIE